MAVITARHSRRTSPSQATPGRSVRRFGRRVGYAAALLPIAVGTVAAVAVGRADRARTWWARVAEQQPELTEGSGPRPGPVRLLAHAVLAVPLGLLALIPVGVEILFVLRGVCYGLVDHGPYDHSWGGPTAGGAWLAHFGIGLPCAAGGVLVLWLLNRLHARLAGRLWGRRVGFGPVLLTVLACVGGVALMTAWIHQL
ncbi:MULTISPECIES: hypothetical protein [Streptacidiphilus]|uniref:Uncharacterized protein n=1 Tax=Streptacidiphilus cavernicola TaxID=3342716 RepID=A0ABV6UH57_9ACTN|nr:hypothetical protein [Streptacidiphilus jeojiense]